MLPRVASECKTCQNIFEAICFTRQAPSASTAGEVRLPGRRFGSRRAVDGPARSHARFLSIGFPV